MSTPNFSPETEVAGESLGDIITELLQEPYAREQHLAEVTLDQLGKLLEEAAEEFESPNLPADLASQAKSYERCKDAYCRILLELESQGVPAGADETLDQLRQRGNMEPPKVEAVPESDMPAADLFDLDMKEGDLPPLDINAAFGDAEPIPLGEGAPEDQGIANIESIWDSAAKQAEENPDERTKITFEELISSPPRSPDEEETEAPARTQTKLRLATPPAPPAPAEESLAEEIEEVTASRAPQTTAESSPAPTAHAGKELYLQLADYLESLKAQGFPLPMHYADRLAAQSLCFAVELECIARLRGPIDRFWAEREDAINDLFDWSDEKFELSSAIKRGLDELVTKHPDWLPDGKFPFAPASNALRFIVATRRAESFRPALIDSGLLLFLFGQDRVMGKVPLKNRLKLHGLTPGEIVELALRLIGMQKLRNRTLTPPPEREAEETLLDRIEVEAHACLKLLEKLGSGGEGD